MRQRESTLHLAFLYFQQAPQLGLAPKELRSFAASCLLLASKFSELDQNIPFLSDVSKVLGKSTFMSCSALTRKEYDRYEPMLCEHFGWALNQLSVFDFTETFMTMGLVFEGETLQSPSSGKGSTRAGRKEAKNLNKLVRTLARVSQLFYELMSFRQSEVGATCVLIAR